MRIRLGLLLCSIRLEVYSFSCLLPCLQLVMDTDMELWRLSDHWCSCSHWVRKGKGPWPRRLPHTTRLCCTAVASLVTDSFSAHTKDMCIWGWKGRTGFLPLPCYCLQSQWTLNSYLSQRQELLTHFSKWMMTCKLSRPANCFVCSFVCFDLKKNPGKRFPAFSVTNSEPMTDLFPMLPLVFRPLTNTHSTTNTYSTRNFHSRATFRAAPGSIPSNWAVRDSTLLVSCTGHLHQLTSGHEQLNTTQSRLCKRVCSGWYIF